MTIAQLDSKVIERNYQHAKEMYAAYGVDTDQVMERMKRISISLHCWQGDDVGGFENPEGELGGGLAVTGNYPGKARTPDELRADLLKAYSLIPGKHRLNLHAFYVDYPEKVERNQLQPKHFQSWIDWSREHGIPLDFNSTFFAHPLASDGWTLASADNGVRQFWIEHAIACRKIAEAMGKAQGSPCIHNLWIPDGEKDLPADRWAPRQRLKESLDAIYREPLDSQYVKDSVESKLFGIGSESYVAGSWEFYLCYAAQKGLLICIDTGHFHPTEQIADKLSAVLLFLPEILLHVSRGIRWDSDHVVILNDETRSIAEELVRGDVLHRVHIGLDYFDASINRVAAWVIGTRAMLKALLVALLEPSHLLKELEAAGDRTARLALMEETKTLPYSAVWDYYCEMRGVPAGTAWLEEVRRYEREVLAKR
ncbi:MAG: L-rhamnose isomerase [bacterium]|nr:L-rhamnose isomerase [bacterium]